MTIRFQLKVPEEWREKARATALYRSYRDIAEDIGAIVARDPAALNRAEVVFLYSGFHALLGHRLAHALHERGFPFLARAVSQLNRFLTGVEIHPAAQIGKGLFIDHGAGVVVGETSVIGDNCTLYQGVTMGGTGKQCGKRHPTLGNNVMVGAGAKLLGNFTVGDNSKIASGAVVLSDVPANCTAVGVPAHVVRKEGLRVDDVDLDQVHIPDPVAKALAELRERISRLEDQISAYEEEKQ